MNRFSSRIWHRLQRHLFLHDLPLTAKLLVFSALFIVIPLTAVGVISYQKSSQVLERQAGDSSRQIIEQVKFHIESYIRGLEIDAIKMVNHPTLNRLLRMSSNDEIEQSGIRNSVLQLLKDTAYSRSDISRITIILDSGTVVDTLEGKTASPALDMRNEYWYNSIPAYGENAYISRFIKINDRTEPVITLAKRVYSPLTLEPVGMLVMDINYRMIQDISDLVTIGRTGHMSILNEEGFYMYHPDMSLLGKQADIPQKDQILSDKDGFFRSDSEPADFYTFSYSYYLRWHLITTIPSSELLQGVTYIRQTILWTVAIALLAAYVLGIGFASNLVRPIRRLQRLMKTVKAGDLSARAPVEARDEIGQLTNDFNKMVERLQVLLEEIYLSRIKETEMSLRQKETELKMLQSQIHPHFLYNSLETIRGMALDKDMTDIATMSSSLARLLRYNLKTQGQTVPLHQEAEICKVYLRIQKFRFEEKIHFSLDIPDWAADADIPKFSLQPIVENSVIHGMEPGLGSVQIRIYVERLSPDAIAVQIADSGLGMSERKLANLQSVLESNSPAADNHIGLVNVHRRIKHLFGEPFGLSIASNPGKGTTVTMKLPYKEGRDTDV